MAPCKSGLLPEGLPCINNNIEIEMETGRNNFSKPMTENSSNFLPAKIEVLISKCRARNDL